MEYNFQDHINGDTFDGVSITTTLNGTPLDLTGASITMNMYMNRGDSPIVFSTANGKIAIIGDPVDGKIEFKKQVVSVVSPAQYFYQMIFTLSDGTVKTYLEGTWNIKKV